MEGTRERGRGRREETGGGFLLNKLTFISALQHTYAGFFGGRYALSGLCTHKCSTSSPRQKKTQ